MPGVLNEVVAGEETGIYVVAKGVYSATQKLRVFSNCSELRFKRKTT